MNYKGKPTKGTKETNEICKFLTKREGIRPLMKEDPRIMYDLWRHKHITDEEYQNFLDNPYGDHNEL